MTHRMSQRNIPFRLRRLAAFSLLELSIAMAILSILIGMVAAISYNYLNLSSAMLLSQRDEMRNQAFLDWVRRSFGNLPGNAVWQITSTEGQAGNAPVLTDMVLQEFPLTLEWSDSPIQIKAIRLRSLMQPNGLLKIDMECYDEEIIDTTTENPEQLLKVDPIVVTPLLEDVRWCEWTVKDPSTDEWKYSLKKTDARPYQLQLNLAMGENGENMREVFWIPPRMNPKLLVNEMKAGSSRNNNAGTGGGHQHRPPGGGSEQPGGGVGEGTPGAPGGQGPPPEGGTPPVAPAAPAGGASQAALSSPGKGGVWTV